MSSELQNLPASMWQQIAAVLMRDPAFPDLIGRTLVDALKAEGVHFVKGDGPDAGWQRHPDFKCRLEAVKLILAYAEGMPLQRIFEHKINESRSSLADALRDDPETLAAVEREVEKAKFRTRKKREAENAIEVP